MNVLRGYALKYVYLVTETLDDALLLTSLLGGACLNRAYQRHGYISITNGFHMLKQFKELFKLYKIGSDEVDAL